MSGENVDLSSDPFKRPDDGPPPGKRFLGVHFACCGVYTRIYINCDETAYTGYCPKCSRHVRMRIGPDGVDTRFFTAY